MTTTEFLIDVNDALPKACHQAQLKATPQKQQEIRATKDIFKADMCKKKCTKTIIETFTLRFNCSLWKVGFGSRL